VPEVEEDEEDESFQDDKEEYEHWSLVPSDKDFIQT
jgi:hypothetical protein